jgi:hypothetical protein
VKVFTLFCKRMRWSLSCIPCSSTAYSVSEYDIHSTLKQKPGPSKYSCNCAEVGDSISGWHLKKTGNLEAVNFLLRHWFWRPVAYLGAWRKAPHSHSYRSSVLKYNAVKWTHSSFFLASVVGCSPTRGRPLKKETPWLLVRNRTIPTEPPPRIGEVSANSCGCRMSRGQRKGFPRPLISVF